jgi:large subunit ribosomal protein L1|tara:strand:+ start:1618 stop:2307 length:690 start_codon:yes stop_codon:yes gene_type:complete
MLLTKNRKLINEKYDRDKEYSLEEAVSMIKDMKFTKFDESVDIALNMGVDPRHADQNIRITTSLPSGTGSEVVILVLTRGPKEKEAKEAGADFVGNDEFIEKLKNGWSDIDKIVATPDMMPSLGKLGKILGPKGLMPNPKSGTVTIDLKKAINELKAGRVELRVEKNGIIHSSFGKTSFDKKDLIENVCTIYEALLKARPASAKGQFIKKITLSSTMGPGFKVDLTTIK